MLILLIGIVFGFHINKNGNFVDDDNAIRVFHGFNVVYKPYPYFPITDHFDVVASFSEDYYKLLQSLGFNIVRLHVAFEAGMQERGKLKDQYLLHIRDIVRLAAKCTLGSTQQIILWGRVPRLGCHQSRLSGPGQFWKRVAELNKEEWNVLGYEILNESASGNFQRSKIQYFWPGWANEELIMPFYRLINQYIREVDTEKLVFFQPNLIDLVNVGFRSNVGGKQFQKKECGNIKLTLLEAVSTWLCKQAYKIMYPSYKSNINHLGTGSMITEFGALPNQQYSLDILNDIMKRADRSLQSYGLIGNINNLMITQQFRIFLSREFLMKMALYSNIRWSHQLDPMLNRSAHLKQITPLKFKSIPNCQTVLYIPDRYHFVNGFEYNCKQKFNKKCQLQGLGQNLFTFIHSSGWIKLSITAKNEQQK